MPEDYDYTVKTVNGKAVYTKVPRKAETQPTPAATAPKINLGCRGRYRAYATAQSKRAGAVISFEKWSQINC